MTNNTANTDIYQIVTDRIIAKLEAGTVPWKHFASTPLQEPRNLVSNKPYQGIKRFLLSASRFNSDWWLSLNKLKSLAATSGKVNAPSSSSFGSLSRLKINRPARRRKFRSSNTLTCSTPINVRV